MFEVIVVGKSDQHVVGNIDGFILLVDDYMGHDAARWLRKYITALKASHEEELADIIEEYEDKLSEVRRDRDDRIAEMEEHYAH